MSDSNSVNSSGDMEGEAGDIGMDSQNGGNILEGGQGGEDDLNDPEEKRQANHEEAAVGSISHIMRTTFKDLFEEFKPSLLTRSTSLLDTLKDEEGKVSSEPTGADEEEAEAAAEEDANIGDSPSRSRSVSAQQEGVPSEGGDEVKEGDSGEEKEDGEGIRQEQEEDEEEDEDDPDEEEGREGDHRGTSKATLLRRHQARADGELADRLAAIDRRLAAQHAQARALLDYLHESHAAADREDRRAADDLKRQGLLVGAHVPGPPSALRLPREALRGAGGGGGGGFADLLVDAKELVGANLAEARRRAGNAPWAGAAGAAKAKRLRPEVPHYLAATPAHALREAQALLGSTAARGAKHRPKKGGQAAGQDAAEGAAAAGDGGGWDFGLGEDADYDAEKAPGEGRGPEEGGQQPAGESVRRAKARRGNKGAGGRGAPAMSLAQAEEERRILKDLDRKVAFLKNPRHDPAAPGNQRMLTSAAPVADRGVHGLFEANPSEVSWEDYAVGGEYTAHFHLRNVSAVSRHLRVLPPATAHFQLAEVRYPGRGGGALAPGMSARVGVRFCPDSLGSYEDELRVLSEGGEMAVRLWARRDPPRLDLADPLDCGACLLGAFRVHEFPVRNVGGRGRFRLLDAADWPQPRRAPHLTPKLRLGPFHVWPTQLDLAPGEAATLFVRYTPQELGHHRARFVLVSEGCGVRRFAVTALTQEVYLGFENIGEAKAGPGLTLPKSLYFDPLAVGELTEDKVTVRNTSCLGVKVHWCFEDTAPSGDKSFYPGTVSHADKGKGIKGFEVEPKEAFIEGGALQEFALRFRPGAVGRRRARAKLVAEGVPLIAVPTGPQEELRRVLRGIGGALGWLHFYTMFDKIDLNGDGFLDIEEIRQAMKKLGMKSNKGAAKKLMAQLNTEGDTAGEGDATITLLEFMRNVPPDLFRKIEEGLDAAEDGDGPDPSQWNSSKTNMKARELEVVLRSVEVLGLDLWGAGEPHRCRCEPPAVVPPGALPAGRPWEAEVVLANDGAAEMAFSVGPALLEDADAATAAAARPGGGGGGGEEERLLPSSAGKVHAEPARGTLAPGARLPLLLGFSFWQAGFVAGRIPISLQPVSVRDAATAPPANKQGGRLKFLPEETLSLRFEAGIMGPRLRISQKEVDFGLIAVGGEEKKEVTITNESDVPVIWDFSQDGNGELRPSSALSALSSARGGGSVSGRISRNPSVSSMSSFGGQSSATKDSFAIDNAFAKLNFSPVSGRIDPRASVTTEVVCTAGKQPQRLRGNLECKVRDINNGNKFESQFLSFRGEIQAPKVYLDTTEIDLGTSYVDQPVKKILTLTNLSNLSTKFKWERPAGKTSAYAVRFFPPEGELRGKEVLQVEMVFTAKSPGLVDDLYACKIFGMRYPLGFSLKSTAKGVVVSYHLLGGEEEVLPPTPWDPTQQPSDPPTLDFGTLGLFNRKVIRFAIRNLSAIPTTFKVHPRKFSVFVPKPNKWKQQASNSALMASNSALMGRQDSHSVVSFAEDASGTSLLFDEKGGNPLQMGQDTLLHGMGEKKDIFRSEKGRAHIEAKAVAVEDISVLAGGNGVAFGVNPAKGELEPWGMQEVAVTVHNDMPGAYADELQCDVKGAPRTNLGAKVKITGCPLSIPKDSVGMRFTADQKFPTLTFGEVLTKALPPTRIIRIKNSGPIDADVKWHVRDPKELAQAAPGGRPRLVDFRLCYPEGPSPDLVRVDLKWHEPPPYTPPFEVRPSNKLVPARSEATFEVAIPQIPVDEGEIDAVLVADARWLHPPPPPPPGPGGAPAAASASAAAAAAAAGLPPKTAREGAGPSRAGPRAGGGGGGGVGEAAAGLEAESPAAVRCVVRSNAVAPRLDAGGKTGLKFRVWSTHAATLGKFRNKKAPHPSMSRQLVLTNRQTVPLTFTLATAGPFRVLSAHCLAPPHPLQQTLFTTSLGGKAAEGEIYTLPPGDNVVVDLGFLANAASQTLAGTAALSNNKPITLMEQVNGSMTVTFSTGCTQQIDLTGNILRPMLVCSPSKYHFGIGMVGGDGVSIYLSISNPTEVEANWNLIHVPSKTFTKSRLAGLGGMVQNTDNPDVFEFSTKQGTLAGPTMPLQTAAVCLPTDVNRADQAVFKQTITTLKWHQPGEKEEAQKAPFSLNVSFRPLENVEYSSRFRLQVANGEGFDFVLSGKGTYEENEQKFSGQPRL